MRSLLRLDFYRLKKSRLFYCLLVTSFVLPAALMILAACMSSDGKLSSIDGAAGMLFIVVSIELCFFCSLFIGSDQDQGTIKNKRIIGKSKTEILLSSALVCVTASILFTLMASLALLIVIIIFGIQVDWSVCIWYFPILFLSLAALSIFFGALSFSVSRKVSAVILCVLALLILYLGAGMILGRLQEPAQTPYFSLIDGESVAEIFPNPSYVSGTMRTVLEYTLGIFPTGQAYEIMTGFQVHPVVLLFESVLFAAVSLAIGLLIFNHRDLS